MHKKRFVTEHVFEAWNKQIMLKNLSCSESSESFYSELSLACETRRFNLANILAKKEKLFYISNIKYYKYYFIWVESAF